mmetsp:Transcript_6823/g.20754  ORF Transcript_6823/g.20754 Transcript_6823/m.20754 type:complete len:80 (+) Transcript_6823:257-496(+)
MAIAKTLSSPTHVQRFSRQCATVLRGHQQGPENATDGRAHTKSATLSDEMNVVHDVFLLSYYEGNGSVCFAAVDLTSRP